MEDKEEKAYKELVKEMSPLSYKDVAEDWENNPKEWYHALIAIVDLPIVLAVPDLKIEDFAAGDYLDYKDENEKLHFCLFLSLTEAVDLLLMVIKTALKNGF